MTTTAYPTSSEAVCLKAVLKWNEDICLFEVLLPVEYTFGGIGFDSKVQDCCEWVSSEQSPEVTLAPFQILSNVTSLLSGEMSVKGP